MKLDAITCVSLRSTGRRRDDHRQILETTCGARDAEKTKAQLIAEIASLRAQLESQGQKSPQPADALEDAPTVSHSRRPKAAATNGRHAADATANGASGTRRKPNHDTSADLYVQDERGELLAREQAARLEAEAANDRLQVLQTIIEIALTHLAPDGLLQAVLPQVRSALQLDVVAVLLLDESDGTLAFRAADGFDIAPLANVRVSVEMGVARRLVSALRPLSLDDLSGLDLASRFPASIKMLAGMPLRVERSLMGVLVLGTGEPHTFSREDTRLLQLVADRISLALDRTQAYQSERKARTLMQQIADQLLHQAAELETIIEAIPSAVAVCDREGKITRINAFGEAVFGNPTRGERRESPFTRRLYHPNGPPMTHDEYPLARALRGETATDFRFAVLRESDGEELELLASFAPLYDSSGEIVGAVCAASDITDITRLERQKVEFLSVASHELKTPLTSLKILTQLTQRRLVRAGVAEAEQLVGMERSIGRMELLVNDLLDISRIEGGKLAMRVEEADLAAVCRAVAEEQMTASERRIKVNMPTKPLLVPMDAERIAQVLTNLVSNALKYSTHNCPVTISARREDEEALVAVHDEGSGIPPESQELLFERFYRVPGVQVQTGSEVGMGLGLYISREIVERHGGRIWVESQVGEGTTFFFTLPLEQ